PPQFSQSASWWYRVRTPRWWYPSSRYFQTVLKFDTGSFKMAQKRFTTKVNYKPAHRHQARTRHSQLSRCALISRVCSFLHLRLPTICRYAQDELNLCRTNTGEC